MRHALPIFAMSAALILSACNHTTETTDLASAEAPLLVNVLDCGTIEISDLDGFSSAGDYAGVSDTFTDSCFLVRHPKGNMLWDLGVPGMLAGNGPMKNGAFTVTLGQTLTAQVEDLGLAMSDIDLVSISHSHFDHVGQADQIDGSLWLVHENELNHMMPADGSAPAVPADQAALFQMFAPLEKKVFAEEYDVFGDGSVVIVPAPGHTPGHTYLQLNMPESGYVLLSGDLYHRAESRDLKRVPRFNFDEEMTRASMAEFEARAKALEAKVIIQHEPAHIQPLGGVIR